MKTLLFPRFPQEIFDQVIEQFMVVLPLEPWDTDGRLAKNALMQCRLVCHAFCDTASSHLFYDVSIEYDEEKVRAFTRLVESPQGRVLPHIGSLEFSIPSFRKSRRDDFTCEQICDTVSFFLDKILHLHRTRLRIALRRLHVQFRPSPTHMFRWSDLTSELRANLTSVCRQLPLEQLGLSFLEQVPPELFEHVQSETLVLGIYTPLPVDDSLPPLPTAILPAPEETPLRSRIKYLAMCDPSIVWMLAPLTEIAFGRTWRTVVGHQPTIISLHAPTLEGLSFSSGSGFWTQAPVLEMLGRTMFPQLKKLRFIDDARYRFEAQSEEADGLPQLFFHYHPSETVAILRSFGTGSNAPCWEEVGIEISLRIAPQDAHRGSWFT